MRKTTRLFLLVGCGVILALELPRTAAELAEGWRGPYAAHAAHASTPARAAVEASTAALLFGGTRAARTASPARLARR